MNTPAASSATDALRFRDMPVRHAMVDGIPYFYAADIFAALKISTGLDAILRHPSLPPFAWSELVDPEEGTVPAFSAVGVLYVTEMTGKYDGQALTAWVRREALRLCPNPKAGDPAMVLTILPDACLPPVPAKYSGYLAAWHDLRESPEGEKAIGRWPHFYAPIYGPRKAAEDALIAAEDARLDALVAARSQEA